MPANEHILHVVEPTLQTEQGHCFGLVRSLCEASPALYHILWVGRQLPEQALAATGGEVRKFFHRRWRKLQVFFLYRRLLKQPGAIVITTAGRIDLLALHWVASEPIPPSKVFLYFHWLRMTPRKKAFFLRFARRQPNVVMFATTPSVQKLLEDCGFRHAITMPYPVTAESAVGSATAFRHVLFAGAARTDKGFGSVVDLVEFLSRRGESVHVSVQTSADHYDKYDARTRADLDRLSHLHYPHLTVRPETLSAEEYGALFAGAICLQPYTREEFADRVSGVTLDALVAGAPVVTLSHTWIARLVERFDAGVVLEDATPDALYEAVRRIIDDYSSYQRRALAAGMAIRKESRWKELMEMLELRPARAE